MSGDSLVEHVARAIHDVQHAATDWDGETDRFQEVFRDYARAAIAAIQTPTRWVKVDGPTVRSDPELMTNPEGDKRILRRVRELSKQRNARNGGYVSPPEPITNEQLPQAPAGRPPGSMK